MPARNVKAWKQTVPVVKIAPTTQTDHSKSIVTAGLLAYILIAKFCDALPFYRQERQFERIGAEISRANMCNWAMKAASACQPVLSLLQQEIRSGPLINIDETTVQVLYEPGRAHRQNPICGYVAEVRLTGRRCSIIMLQADLLMLPKIFSKDTAVWYSPMDIAAMIFLTICRRVHHAGCLAHARRIFMMRKKRRGKIKKPGSVDIAFGYIRKIYAVESEAKKKEISGEQLFIYVRKKQNRSSMTFLKWLSKKSLQVVPKSLLGKAVNYTLNQWSRLLVYLDHPFMTPDNNLAENAIRPFVIGRKNWLFSGTPDGASASADLYSLIETAKANKLEPYKYLRYLFEKIPFAENENDYRALLPMNLKPEQLVLTDIPTGV